jgi:pimeloyl-ACP methyl ester carboxylesterase
VQPGVVLVHGLASTSRLWNGVAERLASTGITTAAVDLRSHGDSDAPEDGYDTETAAHDLAAVLIALSDEPVVLAGQSWGGNVALQVAAQDRASVRALVLVDGGWIDLRRSFGTWERALGALTPPAIDGLPHEEFREVVASSLVGFPPGAVDAATSVVRVRADGTIERRLSVDRHLQILRSMWDDDPTRWYPTVHCPVVLLPAVPAGDTLPDTVRGAAAGLSDARVRPQVGAHHDVHLQRPDEVAAEIRSLLP